MSVYEPEDIAEWEDKQMNKGLFQIEEIEIIEFDDENNEKTSNWWAVTSILDNVNNCYECRNKEVAEELCRHMNLLTQDLMLEQKLPKPLTLENVIDDFKPLAELLNDKATKLEELRQAINHELVCELDYLHESNQIKLDPNKIKEDLELSKMPTEKQINAYAEENLTHEYDLWKIAKANTSLIKQQLDLINDRISFEKYVLRLKE